MSGFVAIIGKLGHPSMLIHRATEIGHHEDNDDPFVYKNLNMNDFEKDEHVFTYDNRYVIAFYGRVYNKEALIKKLSNLEYSFKTSSDAQIVIALYKEFGKDFVKELNGMFAFVIWDQLEKTLFASRDPFGIKPLYYSYSNNDIILATDSKPIRHLFQHVELHYESLQHYFTFQYVPEPYTMVNDIYKLEAGHYLFKKWDEEVEIKKYWEPTFQPINRNKNEVKEQIINTLRSSVHRHLQSDVPVGAFLSSGIDSTAIVALAKEVQPDIKTFTVGFEQEGFNEIQIAKETAQYLGVENIHYTISAEQFLEELPKIISYMDEPIADPSAIPLYFVSRLASEHVNVVLSGEGADELFGGYTIYREPQSLKIFSFLPASLKKALRWFAYKLPEQMKGRSFIERGTTPLERRFIGNAKIFSEEEKSLLLKNYDPTKPFYHITDPIYEKCKTYDDVLKMQYVDIHTWLRGDILAKAEKMSIANSIELRVPFLDKQVFSVARELETRDKISRKNTKILLREAIKDYVPDWVYQRKKLGFPVPIRYWLKNEWYDWARKTIVESKTDHLFHKTYILELLEKHCLGKEDNSRKLWTILTFMVWYEILVEGSNVLLENESFK